MRLLAGHAGESPASRRVGWCIAILFVALGVLNSILPRTEKTSLLREEYRGYHYALGIGLLIFAIWRLELWLRYAQRPVAGHLPQTCIRWINGLCLLTLWLLVLSALFGFGYGWGEGHRLHFAGLFDLPSLMQPSRSLWQFSGYFHSGLGFATRLLAAAAVLTGIYTLVRYRTGLVRAFPAGFGPMFYLSILVMVYALNSFQAPAPGLLAAAIFLVATPVVWGLCLLLGKAGLAVYPQEYGAGGGHWAWTSAAAIGLLAICAFGLYVPHLMFRVTPWPVGVEVAAPPGVTSHQAPVATVRVRPATAFERQVDAETFRWCRFCHTFRRNEPHLVGPNLHAIFGQRAGTVPNFHFSPAMAEAGAPGLVWNDQTLSAYLADPDGFLPGTSMIISSGPVGGAERRAAVINLLKRESMPASHRREEDP